MRHSKITWFFIFGGIVFALVWAIRSAYGPQAGGSQRFAVIGSTGTAVKGNAVLGTGVSECATTFGSEARLCSSADVKNTSDLLSKAPARSNWVHPFEVGDSRAEDLLSCEGWSTSSSTVTGLAFNNAGFARISCDNDLPVLCCVPE